MKDLVRGLELTFHRNSNLLIYRAKADNQASVDKNCSKIVLAVDLFFVNLLRTIYNNQTKNYQLKIKLGYFYNTVLKAVDVDNR